jgi:hypothetical protein
MPCEQPSPRHHPCHSRCRREAHSGVGRAPCRATRGTREPSRHSQPARGRPTATWESHDGLVSTNFVIKIGLMTRAHTHPYYIQWLNNSGKAKVTHTIRAHFSIGTYHDYADCDVVLMQACSLLLGRLWQFDTDVVHHGRSNKYTLMHNGKKTILLPLTPNKIVQCDRVTAETDKRESDIQHDQTAPPLSSNAIKLKSRAILATRSDPFVSATVDAPFHALVCRQVLFSLDNITTPLPHAM